MCLPLFVDRAKPFVFWTRHISWDKFCLYGVICFPVHVCGNSINVAGGSPCPPPAVVTEMRCRHDLVGTHLCHLFSFLLLIVVDKRDAAQPSAPSGVILVRKLFPGSSFRKILKSATITPTILIKPTSHLGNHCLFHAFWKLESVR